MRPRYGMYSIAVLGLFILLLMPVFVAGTSHFETVGGPGGKIKVPTPFGIGPSGTKSFGDLVTAIINILLFVIGSISIIFFILGGFRYVTAHGNEEMAEGAKKTMIHAIIGLVVVIMSFAVIFIITSILISGRGGVGITP